MQIYDLLVVSYSSKNGATIKTNGNYIAKKFIVEENKQLFSKALSMIIFSNFYISKSADANTVSSILKWVNIFLFF